MITPKMRDHPIEKWADVCIDISPNKINPWKDAKHYWLLREWKSKL